MRMNQRKFPKSVNSLAQPAEGIELETFVGAKKTKSGSGQQ